MAEQRRVFGNFEGNDVEEVVLTSPAGVKISILTYAALIRDWQVPIAGGMRSVVLGFEYFDHYLTHSPYFGAIAGRVANRIAKSTFKLDGKTYSLPANEGRNHLHGGPRGMGKRNWTIAEYDGTGVTLVFDSPDGEMGYPGNLAVSVTYRLDGHRLGIDFEAKTDTATPVNIVQHNYFNLAGKGDVLDHTLQVNAGAYTALDDEQIPTGAILPVSGTDLDFRAARTFHDAQGNPLPVDHNFALDTRRNLDDPIATLTAPDTSLTLRLYSDQPGLQVYNGWKLAPPVPGLGGQQYGKFSGLCLEDQIFPDAINQPHFPSPVIAPDAPYRHRCAIEIA
jgi:aldose 1-epimerase